MDTGLTAISQATPCRILVADDSSTVRHSAELFLRQAGHEVLLAEDGFDALAKVQDHAPDLVFCDIQMPRLDGYQACAVIRRSARFQHLPVVLLSSSDSVFDRARGRVAGAQQHLTKPFTKDQLLDAVRRWATLSPETS